MKEDNINHEAAEQVTHEPSNQETTEQLTSVLTDALKPSCQRHVSCANVFDIDEPTFRSGIQRPLSWSVVWSDLMMTMFILFLTMYAYQAAHQEFLTRKTPEIVGGTTTEALESDKLSGRIAALHPVGQGVPLMIAGTIKKVEKISTNDVDFTFLPPAESEPKKSPGQMRKTSEKYSAESSKNIQNTHDRQPTLSAQATQENRPKNEDQDIYRLSKEALETNKLEKFASIDLVPDNTMRIILTGDLLFSTGQADISHDARASLEKLTQVMKATPYMINVVGHTDNIPMHSAKYTSNWELSIARASSVARFLIEEMGMNPGQFVVSGYSSFRPLVQNTDEANRAKNRRVEIIISKHLPAPVPATSDNLH